MIIINEFINWKETKDGMICDYGDAYIGAENNFYDSYLEMVCKEKY